MINCWLAANLVRYTCSSTKGKLVNFCTFQNWDSFFWWLLYFVVICKLAKEPEKKAITKMPKVSHEIKIATNSHQPNLGTCLLAVGKKYYLQPSAWLKTVLSKLASCIRNRVYTHSPVKIFCCNDKKEAWTRSKLARMCTFLKLIRSLCFSVLGFKSFLYLEIYNDQSKSIFLSKNKSIVKIK